MIYFRIDRSSSQDVRELVDQSLLSVAQNSFSDAYQCLVKANQLEPANIMVNHIPYVSIICYYLCHSLLGVKQHGRLSSVFRKIKRGHLCYGKRGQFEPQSWSERKSTAESVHALRIGIIEHDDEETSITSTTVPIQKRHRHKRHHLPQIAHVNQETQFEVT